MHLSVSFLDKQGLRWLDVWGLGEVGAGAGALAPEDKYLGVAFFVICS